MGNEIFMKGKGARLLYYTILQQVLFLRTFWWNNDDIESI